MCEGPQEINPPRRTDGLTPRYSTQQQLIREHEATRAAAADVAAVSGLDPEALQALPESIRCAVVLYCVGGEA